MDKEKAKDTCKIGQMSLCCRYLVCGSYGLECAKLSGEMAKQLDYRVSKGQMVAQGDNCKGEKMI